MFSQEIQNLRRHATIPYPVAYVLNGIRQMNDLNGIRQMNDRRELSCGRFCGVVEEYLASMTATAYKNDDASGIGFQVAGPGGTH